jgi:hypothetical protein
MSNAAVPGIGLLAVVVVAITVLRLTALGDRSRALWRTYTPLQRVVTVAILAAFGVIFVRALTR